MIPHDVSAWLKRSLGQVPHHTLELAGNSASAVLVPIFGRGAASKVLFVRKSAHLAKHAGQLGFPGGRVETSDADIAAAALREAWEEVGLSPLSVEIIGRLNDERTFVTDYHISPLVGWVENPPELWRVDAREIEYAVEVDLAEILSSEPVSWVEFTFSGVTYKAPRYEFSDGVVVWGASARILYDLVDRLRANSAAFGANSDGKPAD